LVIRGTANLVRSDDFGRLDRAPLLIDQFEAGSASVVGVLLPW